MNKRRTFLGFLLILLPAVLWLVSRQALAVDRESRGGAAAVYACYLPQVCQRYPTRTFTPTRTPSITLSPTDSELPDLIIPAWFWGIAYAGCPWGSPGTIYVRVENQGPVAAGFFVVTINGTTATVERLPALSSTLAGVPFARGPVGHVEAFADSSGLIRESNERNNNGRIMFTPPPPCSTNTPAP